MYISASSREKKSSNNLHVLNLTIYSNSEIIDSIANMNSAPFFESNLEDIVLNCSQQSSFEYILPATIDSENNHIFIDFDFQDAVNFTSYKNGALHFENITKELQGQYEIAINLVDDNIINSLSSLYFLKLIIVYSEPNVAE